jgi:hypothetical protein
MLYAVLGAKDEDEEVGKALSLFLKYLCTSTFLFVYLYRFVS